MNSSSTVAELAKALCLVQAEITDVEKDARSRVHEYATLGAVLKIARPILSKHKICFVQVGKCYQHAESGWTDAEIGWADVVSVETILIHASGEWISSVFSVRLPEKDEKDVDRNGKSNRTANAVAQQIGIIVSYLKRYGLASMIGIAQKDTDAEDEVQLPVSTIPVATEYPMPLQMAEIITQKTLSELKHFLNVAQEEETMNEWLLSKSLTIEMLSEKQGKQFLDKLISKRDYYAKNIEET
jgi:ERF superfamily